MPDTQEKFYKKLLGGVGEKQAVKYLKKQKYKILEKNYTTPIGEIDVIAKDKETLVFIEVKTRTNVRYGEPIESVTPFKQGHIIRVAEYYMKVNKIDFDETPCRFDVIEVKNDNGKNEINHVEDAFGVNNQWRRKQY